MKQFFCLTIILIFAVVNNVQSEMTEEAEKVLADIGFCKKETGSSDADVEEFFSRIMPLTKTAKCLNKCMLNRMEIFKDGKLSEDGLIKVVKMDKSDLKGKDGKSLADSIKDIIGDCAKITDPDECEFAAKLRTCLNAAAKKREFCPNVF